MTRHQQISRLRGYGVSHEEIAQQFGITPAEVEKIDRQEKARAKVRAGRVAEPLPGLKALDWKTTRPPEDRVRRGEPCRSPGCEGTVERGSYCLAHAALLYAARAA
jgi:hypothetical protein